MKKTQNRKIAEEAIAFLDKHRLDATPANYTFAYLYLTATTSEMHKAVVEMTDGGFRLTQEEVDELMGRAPSMAGTSSSQIDEARAEVRHHLLSLADLTCASIEDAHSFGRDLATGVEQVAAGADILTIVRGMIERTAEIERKLEVTRKETEQLREDLDAARNDAFRDSLTNLPNRRAVDRQAMTALEECKQLAIAFCDIDHFKSINDKFGHAVGDRVLKAVAETLSEVLSPHTVARFGGEEFVVLMPGVDAEIAFQLIERARCILAARSLRVRETGEEIGAVTFSAGIATTSRDPEEALREADILLYKAKSGGRNRTVYKMAA